MRHAMRAFGLNLKRWSEDYPGATVVVGVILASGAFFGLLALAHGCETKATAACGLATAEKQMGGCGVEARCEATKRAWGKDGGHAGTLHIGEWLHTGEANAAQAVDRRPIRFESGQPPISLQAVAVPLVEGPREAPAGQPAVPPVGPGGRHFRVTAYCPCEKCCGRWADGITANGTRADHRLVAAPREFPFGMVMAIPGYGTVRVEDRGGAIRGDRLDVLFPTHAEALVWGVRWMNVAIGQ